MRICFVSPSIYGYFDQSRFAEAAGGGAQRQLYLLSREFSDEHDVHFVVGDYGQPGTEVIDGVTMQRSFRPLGSTFRKPLELVQLFRAMQRAAADVHISRNKPSMAVASFACARLLGKPWVFNVANDRFVQRDLSYLSAPLRFAYVQAIQRADAVIAQTDHQQANLKEVFDVEATVVSNGYTRMEERPGYDEREVFLWVGHLDPEQKRPRLFLDLAERVPDAQFMLIGARGSDEFRNGLESDMRELDNLQYEFDVPPDQIHQYYERALALVSTSAYEGFPNTFLEAWRAGTPVLSLSVDPNRFLDQGPETEFVADDLSQLAEQIETFNDGSEFWSSISNHVKREFERKYSIEEIADQYVDALAGVR